MGVLCKSTKVNKRSERGLRRSGKGAIMSTNQNERMFENVLST